MQVRALVVDDVRENREVLRQMLGELGCEVEVAENGLEAVEIACRSRPDIVFLDIRMPVMDGLAAAQEIRKRFESGRSSGAGVQSAGPPREGTRPTGAGRPGPP